jgi:hypothetical protein
VTSQKMTIIIIIIITTTTTSAVHSSNFDCMSLLNHLCSPTPIPRFLSTYNYHRRRPLGSYTLQNRMQCAWNEGVHSGTVFHVQRFCKARSQSRRKYPGYCYVTTGKKFPTTYTA